MRHILVWLLAALPLAALAAPLPPALMLVQKQGGSVGQSFAAPDGLTGWVVTFPNRSLIVYTTVSGNYLISGLVLDQSGADLTAQYLDRYFPKADVTKLAATLAADPTLVNEGSPKAPPLYVFADANCFYCNKLWNELRPYVTSGKVRVHWAMLAFLKPTSQGRAAAILAAPDKTAALFTDESKFDLPKEEGGIAPLDPVPGDIAAALDRHNSEMTSAGANGTPLLIYRNDGKWQSVDGMPADIQAFVTALQQ
ncbi:MAG TPA: thiol:disulfide interchange protein DsbG [Gammaproteobacteria bacterium]|jgi:thiol:disulfide interchange protein DsbG